MRSPSADATARIQRLIVVSLIGAALGFLVVVQLRSQATVAASLAAQDDTSVALLINDLNRANNQLIQQAAALTQQQAQLQHALSSGGADAQGIQRELSILEAVNGTVPVHGPGLTIRIDGSVLDFELQDVLNTLRNAGGEAFSLNGTRIIGTTGILTRNSTLLINGRAVSRPLILNVIGDPEQLGPAADLAVSSLQTRVPVNIQRVSDLAITEVVSARPLIYGQSGT
jgi:uncharacterized protein YlxW (UPF0749 family)